MEDGWHQPTVTPFHKKGKNLRENYRQISLTCIICKIVEAIVRNQLVDFWSGLELFNPERIAHKWQIYFCAITSSRNIHPLSPPGISRQHRNLRSNMFCCKVRSKTWGYELWRAKTYGNTGTYVGFQLLLKTGKSSDTTINLTKWEISRFWST